jgi:voltage-gated potassium channel
MTLRTRLLYAGFLLVGLITVSTIGYLLLGGPDVSFLQALYMAVITVAGVGYGEIVDTSHHPVLRVFNIGIVLFGVAITVYVFSVVAAFLVEVEASNPFWRRRMQHRIGETSGHYVICGMGDTGRHAAGELQKTGMPYVVVDNVEDNVKRARTLHPELFNEVMYVIGDATEEDVLEQAGLARAKGLLAALPHDKDNLVITVLAHQKYPKLRVVVRATDPKAAERIAKAGANATVSVSQIGGLRMASEAIRPHAVGFLDAMLKEQNKTVRVEDLEVATSSSWAGQRLTELDLKGRFNLLVLGLKHPTGSNLPEIVVNPSEQATVSGGGVIIAMGDMTDFERARKAVASR